MPTRPKLKPAAIHPDLKDVLYSETRIKFRMRSLAHELKATYGDGEFTIVSLHQRRDHVHGRSHARNRQSRRLGCIRITAPARECRGHAQVVASLTLDIRNRHVLIMSDLLDTGKTMKLVAGLVQKLHPASLRIPKPQNPCV